MKALPIHIGRLDSPRAKGLEKLRACMKRHKTLNNDPMLAHVVNWMEAQGVKMETLAEQDATDTLVDLIFAAYWDREKNYTMTGTVAEILAGRPTIEAGTQMIMSLDDLI